MFGNKLKINGDITIIYVTKRNGETFEVLIDTEDLYIFKELNHMVGVAWNKTTNSYYAAITHYLGLINGKPKTKTFLVHRLIMHEEETTNYVDHVNPKLTLDNRKYNLRVTTVENNSKHRGRLNSNNKSGYRNVSWNKRDNCWTVQLQIEGKRTILKRFPEDQLEEAGSYAKLMREKYYGEFAGEG